MRSKRVTGHIPKNAFFINSFVKWDLYEINKNNEQWKNFKLIKKTKGTKKANWNIGWNGDRISITKENIIMQKYYPDLFVDVIKFLNDNYSINGNKA